MEYRITYEKRKQTGELFEKVSSSCRIVAHNLVEATDWALANANPNERVKSVETTVDV
jgi:hypothetical protein